MFHSAMEQIGKQEAKHRKLREEKVSQNICKEKKIYHPEVLVHKNALQELNTKSIQKYSRSQPVNNVSNQKSVRENDKRREHFLKGQ